MARSKKIAKNAVPAIRLLADLRGMIAGVFAEERTLNTLCAKLGGRVFNRSRQRSVERLLPGCESRASSMAVR